MRFQRLRRSCASTEKIGSTSTITLSASRSRRLVTEMSRSSASVASLPSISPEWMPFWISTIGLPVARASSGVNARSFDSTTSGSARPWPLVP